MLQSGVLLIYNNNKRYFFQNMSNYRDGNKRGNPWGRGRGNSRPQGESNQSSRSHDQNPKPGQKINKSNTSLSATQDKFLKAKQQMQEAADKHKLSGYESSSEEEELESENILGLLTIYHLLQFVL